MDTFRRHRVAANIRAENARRGGTQLELARWLGISQQAMSRRLTGEIAFDVDELQAVAEHFGVPTSHLLGEDAARVPIASGEARPA